MGKLQSVYFSSLRSNLQQIMSDFHKPICRQYGINSSTIPSANISTNPHQNGYYNPNLAPHIPQPPEHSSSEACNLPPPRALVTQSVIFTSRTEAKPRFAGLSKLDSMARHIDTHQNEEFPCQKHNSVDTAPFVRSEASTRQPNPFVSQVMFPKPSSSYRNHEEEKKVCTEPSELDLRRRRQSMDMDSLKRKGEFNSQKFKFLQRSQPFQPLNPNQKQLLSKHDCESTNSGSGAEMLKQKNFDFLKKKKDLKEDKDISTNIAKTMKQFNPLKKSQIIWPLSISPMEQKMTKTFDFSSEPSSATRVENRQHQETTQNLYNTIEFKKKKQFDLPSTPPAPKPQQPRPEQSSRFVPKVSSPENKSEKEDFSFFKARSTKQKRQFKIEDFEIISKLGKGAFGEVFVAQEKALGLICVIKKMSKKRIKQANVAEHIIREIKLQSYLNHSHITSLYGYFHDEQHLYLIMELLPDGSLQQVKKKKKLPEKEAADILRQVACGLKYMHQEYVIHRDLKPENLFLNQGYIKIGDLGCSIYHNAVGLRNTIVGCLEYSSPEQLSQAGYTDKIDSWSLGIMTFELLFGKSPFESDIKKMMMNGDGKTELPEVNFPSAPVVSSEVKHFILNLLDRNPERRMDMDEVLHHPFLKE